MLAWWLNVSNPKRSFPLYRLVMVLAAFFAEFQFLPAILQDLSRTSSRFGGLQVGAAWADELTPSQPSVQSKKASNIRTGWMLRTQSCWDELKVTARFILKIPLRKRGDVKFLLRFAQHSQSILEVQERCLSSLLPRILSGKSRCVNDKNL